MKDNKLKRTVTACAVALIIALAVPLTVIIFGVALPPQFGKTYYAELPEMVSRLKNTGGKRIIVVGNSSVAFGLRGDLMESEIDGYTVCPMGLYGAIGTKAMMGFSKACIREGDIVILAPEQSVQAQSEYFGASYVWRAIESDMGLIKYVSYSDMGAMTGAFAQFAGERYTYWRNDSAPEPEGVYASASFDENCMLVYDRPHNVMPDGYDPTAPVSYSKDIVSDEFAGLVNDYNAYVNSKGAKLYFGFTPVNAAGVAPNTSPEDMDAFCDELTKKLDCGVLGDPKNYVFDCEWFYDNNVHCNSAGAIVYTRTLIKDIKAELCDDSPVNIEIPDKPVIPDEPTEDKGDNSFADCFTYEEKDGRVKITGLTEKGAALSEITVPYSHNGKKIISFSADTFAGNTVITRIRLQSNIKSIADDSFSGCINLERLYAADNENPSSCIVQGGLLNGAPKCRIYVKSSLLSKYAADYFWARFSSVMTAYGD